MGEEGGELKRYESEKRCVLRRERNCLRERECVELKKCWRGGCRNLLREIPVIGEKRVRRRGEAFRKDPSENLSLDVSDE